MIIHDTTPTPMIQAEETRRAPDWNAVYNRYADEYRAAYPNASAEEVQWYAEGCTQDDISGFASVAS
jgi:hypothetical protein